RRPDGAIEYLGRLDHQVKLRGLRIELGEIEAGLRSHPGIRDAVVVVRDGRLVGYVAADAAPDEAAVKAQLATSLPDYMVPSKLVWLERLPVSANGKLDRKALPDPEWESSAGHAEPEGETEQAIARIWRDVLGLQHVSRDDNFFTVGGDSIQSLQVIARARQQGLALTPRDMFQHQTVQALAAVARRQVSMLAVERGPASGPAPLTPIQRWFFDTEIPARHHWNQSVLLAPREVLDPQALRTALAALAGHHDALRLRFTLDADGAWHQHYADAADQDWLWQRAAADDAALERLADEAQRSLDLAQGPLLRALLVDRPDGSQRLLLAVHHLVVDGVSWRILLEDLQAAYRQIVAGTPVALPGRTDDFGAWGRRLETYAGSPALQAELPHWTATLAGDAVALPVDRPEGEATVAQARTHRLALDASTTRQLLRQAPAAYRTRIDDLLLAALARVLCRWTGGASVLVDLEGHGRDALPAEALGGLDISRTVGWFTSLYPVRLAPGDGGPAAVIKAVKEQLRAVPHRGIGYGVLRHLGDAAARATLAAAPRAQVMFNYLGQFDGLLDAEGAFVPAAEPHGAQSDEGAPLGHELVIDGRVIDGALRLDWRFSGDRLDAATVEDLAEAYRTELAGLVAHCLSPDAGGLTPSDLPLSGLDQAGIDALPVPAAAIVDAYPLSPMQQGLLFHALHAPEAGLYVNQINVELDGPLDGPRFVRAWSAAIEQHDILRTGFLWDGDLPAPLQLVQRGLPLPVELRDGRGLDEVQVAALARDERERGFDLAAPPLMRVLLLRLSQDRHQLIWTFHHILMDGWSTARLIGEVLARYRGETPAAGSGRYRDHIAWLAARDPQADEAFWRGQLGRLEAPTRLADALPAPAAGDGHGLLKTSRDAGRTARLTAFARRERITVNTLVQGAWSLLLARYTGQDSVVFGATVAGRPAELAGAETLLGLFINTLPVIQQPVPEVRVGDWLREVQATGLALREHEHTPLNDIQRWAGQGGQTLFDTLLVFENYPIDQAARAGGDLRVAAAETVEATHYPLSLAVQAGDTLDIAYGYRRDAFTPAQIEALSRHLGTLLDRLAEDAGAALGSLSPLAEADLAQLAAWRTEPYRAEPYRCVQDWIAGHASSDPDRVSVVFGDREVSRGELERRANHLAHRLVRSGVGPD
ncbi:condensation domain-containing protein, partial [Inquilinus sp. 2KB_12]